MITESEAVKLFQALAKVNKKIGMLRSEFAHAMVNDSIVSMFSLNESVQSTRIEDTQVTFTDIIENHDSHDNKDETWEEREVRNYYTAFRHGVDVIRSGYPLVQD